MTTVLYHILALNVPRQFNQTHIFAWLSELFRNSHPWLIPALPEMLGDRGHPHYNKMPVNTWRKPTDGSLK